MNEQKWYSHDAGIPHIKLFWLHVFAKKRPSMVANYIIPSEYEMLEILSKNTGVAVTWNINAKNLIQEKKLQLIWNSKEMPSTEVFLLSGKNDNLSSVFQDIEMELKGGFKLITFYKNYYDQYIPKLYEVKKAEHFSLF